MFAQAASLALVPSSFGARVATPRPVVPSCPTPADPFPTYELMACLLELLALELDAGTLDASELAERLAALEALRPSLDEQAHIRTFHGDELRRRIIDAVDRLAEDHPDVVLSPSSPHERMSLREMLLFLELAEAKVRGPRLGYYGQALAEAPFFRATAEEFLAEFAESPRALPLLSDLGFAVETLDAPELPAGSVRVRVKNADGSKAALVECGPHTGFQLAIDGAALDELFAPAALVLDA